MLDFGCWFKTNNAGAKSHPSTNIQHPCHFKPDVGCWILDVGLKPTTPARSAILQPTSNIQNPTSFC
jgi:hypothetical protein